MRIVTVKISGTPTVDDTVNLYVSDTLRGGRSNAGHKVRSADETLEFITEGLLKSAERWIGGTFFSFGRRGTEITILVTDNAPANHWDGEIWGEAHGKKLAIEIEQ